MAAEPIESVTNGSQRAVVVSPKPLIRVGARPSFRSYLRQLWDFRHFIYYDSRSRVSTANTTDSLGRVWMVMNPVMFGMAYFFVFGLLLDLSRGVPNFIGYLVVGVFMFRFATTAVQSGASSIVSNQNVVQAFNFPRAAIPLATNVRELLGSIPVFLVMGALVLAIGDMELGGIPGIPTSVDWLWLMFFPALALCLMMTTGLSLLLARAVSAYTDVKHLVTIGMRIWFYTSAVFFTTERFTEGGRNLDFMVTVMHHNPMYCVLDIVRQAWVYGEQADPYRWIVLSAWSVVLLVVGFIVFWQGEETYGRER